jgi:hypothetical protein
MMTPAQMLNQIERRKINLVHSFDAFWHASVDVNGQTLTTKKRAVRSISVIALTPIGAVEALVSKIDNEAQERALFPPDNPKITPEDWKAPF